MAAPSTAVTPVEAADMVGNVAQAAGHDTSFIGLFLGADPIIMVIMLGLIIMSIMSWAIMIEKYVYFKNVRAKTAAFENEFWSAEALDQLYEKLRKRRAATPLANMFFAAMEEWMRGSKTGRTASATSLRISLRDRMVQMMSVTCNKELERMEKGLSFLATAGSAAPFIGLLGTVLGIMNSFRAIAGQQNTSLAVVAPGIAEALFVTAIGLAVAIPAVIGYNKFSGELARLSGKFDDYITEFNTLIGRQIEGAN